MMMMMMILVLFFLEFFFYFFSRRDLNPDRRFPVAAVTANGNVSTLKPTNESSYFSRSSRRSRRRRSLRQLSTTTRFDPATLDDDSRSGNPGHYGKLSTRILLLGHIHYAYLDRCTMLTRSTGVANTCRNLMVTLLPVDGSASRRERESARKTQNTHLSLA